MRLILATALAATLAALTANAATPALTLLHISSHLAHRARASLDGAAPVSAPGYGSTNVPVAAGTHSLKITTSTGATYVTPLDLKPAALMNWHGKGYWCVNLLARSLEVYSTEDCQEEVTDAG